MGWRAMAVAGVCHGQLIVKREQRNNAGESRLWHRASTTSLVVGGDRALLRGGNLQPCRLASCQVSWLHRRLRMPCALHDMHPTPERAPRIRLNACVHVTHRCSFCSSTSCCWQLAHAYA
jgi:hypothetical protein